MKQIFNGLLLLAVFLAPLLPAFQNFGYEQVKVLFFIFALSLTACFWLIQFFRQRENTANQWSDISQTAATFILKPLSQNNPDLTTTGVEKRVYLWQGYRNAAVAKTIIGVWSGKYLFGII